METESRIRQPSNSLFGRFANDSWLIQAFSRYAIRMFRWLVIGCVAATILITWPLWQVHTAPPMLPLLPLPRFDMGGLLLLSLALILIRPVHGIVVHSLLVLYAICADQIRLQPEIVSLVLLLWGTLPNHGPRTIGRVHLVALWTFAGINKFLSPGFMNGTALWMVSGLISNPPPWLRAASPYLVSLGEFSIGLMALIPRTRKLAAIGAFCLHIGILKVLSPMGYNWNQSVWPWNLALAFAGLALIVPWKDTLPASVRRCHPWVTLVVVYLLISPLGWFVGLSDAYLTYHLYSEDVPSCGSSVVATGMTWSVCNVPLPPEHRLCEQWFQLECHPGDSLTIVDKRWWFQIQGEDVVQIVCPASR